MAKVTHILVQIPKTGKTGKKKYQVLHDLPLLPPREDHQLITALKQQFDLLSFVVKNGKATALVQKKID